jgi:O-antigen ligase
MLGVFLVSSVFLYGGKLKRCKLKTHLPVILFFALYLMYTISFFYSEHSYESLLDLQKKLSLFLLPLAFGITELDRVKKKRLYLVYLIGISIVTAICLFFFVFRIFTDAHFHRVFLNHPIYMMYSKFYIFGNTNYYAVYLNMAALLILGFLSRNNFFVRGKNNNWILITGLLLFVLLSLVISSRAGILAIVILLVFSLYYLYNSRYFRIISLGLIILAGVYVAHNYRFNNYLNLIHIMLESPKAVGKEEFLESDAYRLIFWDGSLGLVGENMWFGVGNGDVKAELSEKYKEMGVYDKIRQKGNPHNQFLRTYIATGLPGFLLLMSLFAYGTVRGIRNRDYLLLAFMLLMFIHFFFKSMLFRIDGVVFFSFFYGLFAANAIRESAAQKDA